VGVVWVVCGCRVGGCVGVWPVGVGVFRWRWGVRHTAGIPGVEDFHQTQRAVAVEGTQRPDSKEGIVRRSMQWGWAEQDGGLQVTLLLPVASTCSGAYAATYCC
jgi:hypothetical protein